MSQKKAPTIKVGDEVHYKVGIGTARATVVAIEGDKVTLKTHKGSTVIRQIHRLKRVQG